jgi:hypothetical protein
MTVMNVGMTGVMTATNVATTAIMMMIDHGRPNESAGVRCQPLSRQA